jgi:hypothetical protein
MKFRQFIEASYGAKDIPDKYFLAFNLRPDTFQQLSGLQLPGIEGVSSSEQIISSFFSQYGAKLLLAMNGVQFESINKISRIQYNNPEYMVSNNLRVLLRLWNYSQNLDDHQSNVRYSFFDCIRKVFFDFSKTNQGNMEFQHKCFEIHNYIQNDKNSSNSMASNFAPLTNIRNTWDLARWLQQGIIQICNINLTLEESHKVVVRALIENGETFQGEKEWLIKNKILKIPKGSELYILVPSINTNPIYASLQARDLEEINSIKNGISNFGLDTIYNIRFVDQERYGMVKSGITYQTLKSISKSTLSQEAEAA